MKHLSLLLRLWPHAGIATLVGILAYANYVPGTFLTGWDNLHPEFNFSLNIQRSLFAAWQEYQGVGLLGGMGHASDLIHQLILLFLSLFLPMPTIRFTWTILTLLIGAIGMYYLLCYFFERQLPHGPHGVRKKLIVLVGSIFYILNLATVQSYYAPFEVFTIHFASLPWLFLTGLRYLENPAKKNLLALSLVLLLSTPQGYVPTIFVVYVCSIALVSLIILIKKQKDTSIVSHFVPLGKLFVIIAVINSFWLFPFLAFTFTKAHTNVNAKINQMSTQTVFLQNKEFGGLRDVLLLKGFWFNNVEPNREGVYTYMLQPWRSHFENPVIPAIGYLLFAIVAVGLLSAVVSRKPLFLAFAGLFLFAFTMVAITTPPFSWIDDFLRNTVPLFNQIFRFPFTKFSILLGFCYALFFAQGVFILGKFLKKKYLFGIYCIFLIILLVAFTFPVFNGNLFYEKERIAIPKEYFDLFAFFQKQDPNTRIANFPQSSFWSWEYYRWGYGGSGFLWYGIRQPILDRAFDPWSNRNENYYFEVSQALYAKNPALFEKVMQKYQVTWIVIDKNIINPSSPKALFIQEMQDMLGQMERVEKEAIIGNILVYKIRLKDAPKDFIFFTPQLSSVNDYAWGNRDQAYIDRGNYISTSDAKKADSLYPFRSLFSGKTQKDIAYSMKETKETIEIESPLPLPQKTTLHIPSLLQRENILPATLLAQKTPQNTLIISIIIQTPQIFIGQKHLWGNNSEYALFELTNTNNNPLSLDINGGPHFLINETVNKKKVIGRTFLSMRQDNILQLTDEKTKANQTQVIGTSFFSTLPELKDTSLQLKLAKNDTLRVLIPKVEDDYLSFSPPLESGIVSSCDYFRKGTVTTTKQPHLGGAFSLAFGSNNASTCISYYLLSLSHKEGYALFTQTHNYSGRGFHFWVLNEDGRFAAIDTYLSDKNTDATSTFVLPPQDEFGTGYSLHFDNISLGSEETNNELQRIVIYPIPYNFLTSILTGKNKKGNPTQSYNAGGFSVSHPYENTYVVSTLPKNKNIGTLVLSQSFDPGWKAYAVKNYESGIMNYGARALPFLFGKEINQHVLVNNWENGWLLDNETMKQSSNETIVIVFLPQYLEYFGFVLGAFCVLFLLIRLPIQHIVQNLTKKKTA